MQDSHWTVVFASSPAATTATPTTPGFLSQNPDFNQRIYTALNICIAVTSICGFMSIAALGVQLARKDQRRLIQKTVKSEGTYLLPHSPILAPLSITIYSIIGIASALVLKTYLWRGSNLVVIQRLILLLPMPVLIWAWLSAFNHAFAWHLTPAPESRALKLLRFKPKSLNWICWLGMPIVFLVQLAIVNEWPVKSALAKHAKQEFELLEKTLAMTDPVLEAARIHALHLAHHAESYYKGAWAVWALSFSVSWVVYTTYSSLLLRLLSCQKEFVNSISTTQQESKITEGSAEKGQSISERVSAIRRASATIIRRTSQGSEMRALSKRQLLRRNAKLVAIELISYSIFTLCWCFLAIVKAALGYKILNNATTGPITVLGELYESSIFGTVAVTLLLIRGINILRNRAPVRNLEASESLSESRRQSLNGSLAARRNKASLSIPLNVGNYIVVGGSTPSTPGFEAPAVPLPVLTIELPTPSLDSGYFTSEIEKPTHIRRKSSVTFLDGLGQPPVEQQVVAVPTLGFAPASPPITATNNTWANSATQIYTLEKPQ